MRKHQFGEHKLCVILSFLWYTTTLSSCVSEQSPSRLVDIEFVKFFFGRLCALYMAWRIPHAFPCCVFDDVVKFFIIRSV